jgi:anti-anti-sigma factor
VRPVLYWISAPAPIFAPPLSASSLPQRFSVTERARDDGTTVLVVCGELDLATAAEVKAALDALAEADRATVLDLSEVSFLDSTGLKVIVQASRASQESGWPFAVAAELSEPVSRLFELVEADSMLRFDA